jgi:single-strand DNA-binding protein
MGYNDNNGGGGGGGGEKKKKWYDVNRLEISGRCGKDPDYKTSANGKELCRFSVAMSEKGYGGSDDKTTWLNVTLFGDTADAARSKNLKKGDIVKLRGKLDVREWTDNDGNRQKLVGMVAFEIAVGISERLSDHRSATSGGKGERRQEPQRREQPTNTGRQEGDPGWDDDPLPF